MIVRRNLILSFDSANPSMAEIRTPSGTLTTSRNALLR